MVAGGSAVTTSAVPAQAAEGEVCTVTAVAWVSDETLQIYCNGAGRWAFGYSTGSTPCPIVSIDARRAWLSLAQGALFSGKPLILNTHECSGGPGISYVRLG
jgi:hypothetical protein